MLDLDNIKEIVLKADHDTTINLLKIYPNFDSANFWKEKCQINYPDKTFLANFTGQENYLLKERTFALTMNDVDDNNISSCLIEYNPILEQQLLITSALIKNNHYYYPLLSIKINIAKQFIVIKRHDEFFNFYQSDGKNNCYERIRKDAMIETYDCCYYIIDANDLTLTIKYDTPNIKYEYIAGSNYNNDL